METHDPTARADTDIDLTGGQPAADDEFAAVPPAPPEELGTPVPADLPPDVQPGSLGGINPSEGDGGEAMIERELTPEEIEAQRLAAAEAERAGETPEEAEPEPETLPGADTPPPAAEAPVEAPQEPEAPVEPAQEPQAPVEDPPPPPPDPAPQPQGKKGGAAAREYVILEEITLIEALRRCSVNPGEELPASVANQIVYVQRTFEVKGETRETLTARNPENALRAAGRFIGEGYSGKMVPVPEGSWKVRPVNTKPRGGFAVDVG